MSEEEKNGDAVSAKDPVSDESSVINDGKKISRRAFVGGVAAGAAGAWGISHGLNRIGRDPAKPPQHYE